MRIRFICGQSSYEIDIIETDLIDEAKKIVETHCQIPKEGQKWIFKGRILGDDITIQDSGICDGDAVHVLKSQTKISSDTQNTSNNIQAQTMIVRTDRFNRAMQMLLTNDETIVKESVEVLVKIITNIVSNPHDPKYRKLKNSNSTFQKKIGTVQGGIIVFESLGFTLLGEDWVLEVSGEAWNNLVSCKMKLDSFLQRMSEGAGKGAQQSNTSTKPLATSAPPAIPVPSSTSSNTPPLDAASLLAMQALLASLTSGTRDGAGQQGAGNGNGKDDGAADKGSDSNDDMI
jgi:hypothetical protein